MGGKSGSGGLATTCMGIIRIILRKSDFVDIVLLIEFCQAVNPAIWVLVLLTEVVTVTRITDTVLQVGK